MASASEVATNVVAGEIIEKEAGEEKQVNNKRPEYLARYGTFILADNPGSSDWRKAAKAIEESLKKDNRITKILDVQHHEEWIYTARLYPARIDPIETDILGRSKDFQAVKLSDPVIFCVSVPVRNQPAFRGVRDIPSDTYWVSWDGITAIAAWKNESDHPPMSGGHVVIDILKDAAENAGFTFYPQACHPTCENVFAHPILGIWTCEDESRNIYKLNSNSNIIAHLHTENEPSTVVARLSRDMAEVGYYFAMVKNYGQRIIDLERFARNRVEQLLALNYVQIQRSRLGLWQRARSMHVARQIHIQSSEHVASLWLLIAASEAVRRDWTAARRTLNQKCTQRHLADVFSVDMQDDEDRILSLDLTFIRSAIEQSATRNDSQRMARATGVGAAVAVMGGLAGAIIGAIIQGSGN